MKAIKLEIINGKKVITTETERKFLFLKLKPEVRKFVAHKRIAGNFWAWLELPDMKLVPDILSFQLDKWLETIIVEIKAKP